MVSGYGSWLRFQSMASGKLSLDEITISLVVNIFLRLFNPIDLGRVSGLKSSLVLFSKGAVFIGPSCSLGILGQSF